MLSTVISNAHGLVGRMVPVLIALQDAPRPSGGAAPSQGGGQQPPAGGYFQLLLPLLVVAFLYFVMIRPANKQRKEQEALQKGLQKGDRVVTSSGIIGTVAGVDEQFVTLEISEKVRVKFLRDAVARKFDATAPAKAGEKPTTAAEAKK
jgi:preprotein translocase subunit YajC